MISRVIWGSISYRTQNGREGRQNIVDTIFCPPGMVFAFMRYARGAINIQIMPLSSAQRLNTIYASMKRRGKVRNIAGTTRRIKQRLRD
jgi:hypothetical protein